MANQMTGRVLLIGPKQSITLKDGRTMYRRELIIDATRFDAYTGEKQFDNFPQFEFGGDRCDELDKFRQGDVVDVSFDLQGTSYVDKQTGEIKYFTRVRGYKIELRRPNPSAQPRADASAHSAPSAQSPAESFQPAVGCINKQQPAGIYLPEPHEEEMLRQMEVEIEHNKKYL